MKPPRFLHCLPLVVLVSLAAFSQGPAQAAQCVGSNVIFVDNLDGDSSGMDFCGAAGAFCDKAILTAGPVYRLEDSGCNPEAGLCDVQVAFQYEFPGNEDNGNSIVPWIFWFDRADVPPGCDPSISPPNPTCPDVDALCGLPGELQILSDFAETWFEVAGVTCDTANNFTEVRSVAAYVCPTSGACRELTAVEGATMGGPAMAAGIGCEPPPPVDDCDDCKACRVPGRGTSAGGGPPRNVTPAKSGPGTLLRYTARGVGHATYPGASLWNPTLGRYWSHDYAERIVVDPDETHVWMMTRTGTFREFSDLAGGVYQANSPSDEHRTLEYLGAGLGWELQSLDGTVQSFDADGVWTQTVDRNGNTTSATYTGMQLTSVSFPDQRSENLTYYFGGPQDGKLETITEVGVGGASMRTWTYEWSGDDLIRIIRPDLTQWELFYNDPRYPGYLTRMDLVGADGTSTRTEAGWEYDDDENVIQTWKGESITDGTGDHPEPDAVDLYQLSFVTPTFPTQTTIINPVGSSNEYTVARDNASLKPKITQITGDCPVCGVGSDSSFTYGDPNHPLLPTSQFDGEGNETQLTYGTGGQVLTRTEAVNDPSLTRTTSWVYDTNFPAFPTEVRMPSTEAGMEKILTMVYDPATGDLLSRTVDGFEAGVALSGQTTTFMYNTAGQPTEIDPPGFTGPGEDDRTEWTYDEANRGGLIPLTRSDPVVRDFGSTSFIPDGFNRRTSVTDPNGLTIETSYDDLDRVDQVIQRGPTPAEDLVTDYEYNAFGDLEEIILPRLNVIEYGYDSAGRLTRIERKLDEVTPGEKAVYTLDGLGNRTREELQDAA